MFITWTKIPGWSEPAKTPVRTRTTICFLPLHHHLIVRVHAKQALKSKADIPRRGGAEVSRVDAAELLVHQQRPTLFIYLFSFFFGKVLLFKRAEMTAAAQQRAAALAAAL